MYYVVLYYVVLGYVVLYYVVLDYMLSALLSPIYHLSLTPHFPSTLLLPAFLQPSPVFSFTAICSPTNSGTAPPSLPVFIITWIARVTLATFAASFAYILTKKNEPFLRRHKPGTFGCLAYSMVDWFLDLTTAGRMLGATTDEGDVFGSVAVLILALNFAGNIALQADIMKEEKKSGEHRQGPR